MTSRNTRGSTASHFDVSYATAISELMWMLLYRERLRSERGADKFRDKEIAALEAVLDYFGFQMPEETRVADTTRQHKIDRTKRRCIITDVETRSSQAQTEPHRLARGDFLRKQNEAARMARSHGSKVPPIRGQHIARFEAFRDGDDGRVDEA